TAEEVLRYDFDHVAVATGANWRRDGVGRASLHPLPIEDGLEVLTPDDLLRGARPSGERIVIYDDDHYYMGAALAELLTDAGKQVVLLTPAPLVSAWTENTMEQSRVHARLAAAGVRIVVSSALSGAGSDGVRFGSVFTDNETT